MTATSDCFTLAPELARDSVLLADWSLCRVLLMNNRCFPWLILVPRVAGARELTDLTAADRHRAMDEIATASSLLQVQFRPDKLNVAALGNKVAQLHIHVIARFTTDAAWPEPVWGKPTEPYADLAAAAAALQQACIRTIPA